MDHLSPGIYRFLLVSLWVLVGALILNGMYRRWRRYRIELRKSRQVAEIRSFSFSSQADTFQDDELDARGGFARLLRRSIIVSFMVTGAVCLVPEQTIDTLVHHIVSVFPEKRPAVDQAERKTRQTKTTGPTEFTFSNDQVARARQEVLDGKQAEMSAVEGSSSGSTPTPGLQWWYEVEFVSGGVMVTNRAEIGEHQVTVVDRHGVEMVIPETEVKEIRQFLR